MLIHIPTGMDTAMAATSTMDTMTNRFLHFLQPLRHGGVLVRPVPGGGDGRLLQGVVGLLAGGAVFQVLLHQGGGVGGAHPVHVQGQQVLDDLTGDFHSNSSFSFSRARW